MSLVPNEDEARTLLAGGEMARSCPEDLAGANWRRSTACGTVVVTLGAAGCVVHGHR